MIQKFLLFLIGTVTVVLISAGKNDNATILKSSGSHISSTGAPGEKTCAAAGCHSDAIVDRDDTKSVTNLILGNNEKTYSTSTKYNLTLKASKSNIGRFGFQIVALDTNNRSIGTFAVPNGSNLVQIQKGAINNFERTYVTHTTAGNKPKITGEAEWNFLWTSHPSYQGKVTFYYCVNATNMNNMNSGDHLYLTSSEFSAKSTNVNEDNLTSSQINVFPSVASGYLNVENELGFENNSEYSIVSSGGIVVMKNQFDNGSKFSLIPLTSLPNGAYSLVVTSPKINIVKRFIVIK